ncbi:hypothetical protein GQ85_12945 [Rhodococcus rhodochrous]|nr:hypothetical protein GQ85_12945 [Rhodococcus rhodochrous]
MRAALTLDDHTSAGSGDEAEMHESFCASHLPWNLRFDPTVAPTSTRVNLGQPWVVGCSVGSMSGYRRAAELRRTPGEYIAVLMIRRGTETLTQRGRSAEVTAGTALGDGVRPVECFSAGTLIKDTLFVPQHLLTDAVPDLDSALARTSRSSHSPA